MQDTKNDGILVNWVSIFLSKWRSELDESFIGRDALLDDFFEKTGSILYFTLIKGRESTSSVHSTKLRTNSSIGMLPTIFLFTGSKGSGKRYFIRELFSSFSKTNFNLKLASSGPVVFNISIDEYIDVSTSTIPSKNVHDLNDQLVYISEEGRHLRSLLRNGLKYPPVILVYFESSNIEQCYIYSNETYRTNTSDQYVILNLISRFVSAWHCEGIPIISFFTSDLDSCTYETNGDLILDPMYIMSSTRHGYRLFFEMNLSASSFQVNKISLFKFLIYRRYGINKSALDYLTKKICDLYSVSIGALSNQELEFIINDIDLIRIKDILSNDELDSVPYITMCGNFIAVVPNGVKPDFFSVFLYYLVSVIGKLDSSTKNAELGVRMPYCGENFAQCGTGLKGIIGCYDAVSKIKNLLLPCAITSPGPSDFQLPVVFDEALGVIVLGEKGCGKLVLGQANENKLYDRSLIFHVENMSLKY